LGPDIFLGTNCGARGGAAAAGGPLRPAVVYVDIFIKDDRVIFISDNKAGVIYRLVYEKMAN